MRSEGDDHATIIREGLQEQIKEYYKEGWEILDFVDLGVKLASRLTDDDIGAILTCIDAKNHLEKLRLTHCFNFVGNGLEPLRNSSTLAEIDMSLARSFEIPKEFEDAKISEEVVLPILTGILNVEETVMGRLQVPRKLVHFHHQSPKLGISLF